MTVDRLVSVIIPARNAEKTVARTLESLLAQTDPGWEALIVDDGSVDATPKIIAQYAARDTRFIALIAGGKGVSAARNLGISRASGDRILFLDSDDWIDRHFLAKMNAALDSNSSAIAAYCNDCRVMPDGSETPVRSDPRVEKNAFEVFARTCATVIHGVLVKKAAVLRAGGFDTDLRTGEDWDLWQRIARIGGGWIHVDEKLSFYWASEHSLTRDVQQMLMDAKIVIERGFSSDYRVDDPAPAHRMGASTTYESTPTAATTYAYFALWCAGVGCGCGKVSVISQNIFADLPKTEAAADAIASVLLDSVMVGIRATPAKLAELWHHYGLEVTNLIAAIGRAWSDPRAARNLQYRFERLVLHYDDLSAPRPLGLTYGIRVDLRRLRTLRLPDNIDRLYVYLCNGPHILTVLDIGVLGEIERHFWMKLITEHLDHLHIEEKVGRLVRLKIKLYRRAKRLPSFLRGNRNGHCNRLQALQVRMSHQATSLPVPGFAASNSGRSRGAEKSRDMAREVFWEELFEEEDPWNYESAYEQEKYARQLENLPAEPLERALELACAEGHLTRQLAPRVKHLLASDISSKALERARVRCKEHQNVDFVKLDFSADALPQAMDLIVCSEVLYYLHDEAELQIVARRLMEALRPGGHLLMAHAFVLKDDMSRTAFDWDNPFGAETIARVVGSIPGLALEASIRTELYRVDRFRRLHPDEATPVPRMQVAQVDAPIETEVARFILWNGAAARRSELARLETRQHVPILMYHRVAVDGPEELARYRLSPDAFGEQMLWLRRNGYHTINSGQLAWFAAKNYPLAGRPVLITFDDGYEDFAEQAWPILQANDFSAEVFIVTDLVGRRAEWDASLGAPAPLMDAAKIAALAVEGVSFGSHLASHPRSSELSTSELAEELLRSRSQLEKWVQRPVKSVAAPYGCTDQRLRILAAECGFEIGFNTVNGAANLKHDLLDLPRIEVRGDWTLARFASCMESYQ